MTENRSKAIKSRRESGGKPLKSPKLASAISHEEGGVKKHLKMVLVWFAAPLTGQSDSHDPSKTVLKLLGLPCPESIR